jgi:hypothetical protein
MNDDLEATVAYFSGETEENNNNLQNSQSLFKQQC